MSDVPVGQHITYQLQYRTCGKSPCFTCASRAGHGPYWYGYWKEGGRTRHIYLGKRRPQQVTDEMADHARLLAAQTAARHRDRLRKRG